MVIEMNSTLKKRLDEVEEALGSESDNSRLFGLLDDGNFRQGGGSNKIFTPAELHAWIQRHGGPVLIWDTPAPGENVR